MKFLGKILDPKDLTTKEYVDKKCQDLDNKKVDGESIEEYTAAEVQQLWNKIFSN